MYRLVSCTILAVALVNAIDKPLKASTDSIGPNGIHANGLLDFTLNPLTGAGIKIGQVEDARPADSGVDSPANVNQFVNPAAVFKLNGPPVPDEDISGQGGHATQVASVIISADSTDPNMDGDTPIGVSPGVQLYSSATSEPVNPAQPEAALTAQHIANQGNIRAVNVSFGEQLVGGYVTDGNSLFTQFIDWSASQHDILYVVSGSQVGSNFVVPKDNFNGMTIARSAKVGNVYRRVSTQNRYDLDAVGDRTSISLLAPGEMVEVTGLGGAQTRVSGTSFAAPHVTGTVALLQDYAEERIMAGAAGWDADARRHEVMKAVLMNSADKIAEGTAPPPGALPIPPGGLLGMERTVVKQDGVSTWFDSDAYDDSILGQGQFYPLDEEMGAGHLNASRALTNVRTGEQNYEAGDVPLVGWDYGTTTGAGDNNRYRFSEQLLAGSFVSITIASDRDVDFATDAGTLNQYDVGDTFEEYVDDGINPPDDSVINDLDLYFLPKFSGNTGNAEAASIATVGTVDHIFFQVPTTGNWEFWVVQHDQEAEVGTNQNYAVAWWAKSAAGPTLGGDFNNDSVVNGADMAVWKTNFGIGPGADADGDGDSDGADFLTWQRDVGMSSATSTTVAVPEPSTWMLSCFGMLLLWRNRAMMRSLACVCTAIVAFAHGDCALAVPSAVYNPETGNLLLTNDAASTALAFDSFSRLAYSSNPADFTIVPALPSGAKFDQGDLPWAFAFLYLPVGTYDLGNVVVPYTPPSDLRLFSYPTLPGNVVWGSITVTEGFSGSYSSPAPTSSAGAPSTPEELTELYVPPSPTRRGFDPSNPPPWALEKLGKYDSQWWVHAALAVPEPAAWMLFAFGLPVLIRRRRGRAHFAGC